MGGNVGAARQSIRSSRATVPRCVWNSAPGSSRVYDGCLLVLSQQKRWDTRPGCLRLLVNTQLFSHACPILNARPVSSRAVIQCDSAGC